MDSKACDQKEKCSTRSPCFGRFVRSKLRLIVSFQAGVAAGVLFMIVLFMPLNWSSNGHVLNSASPPFSSRRGQFLQKSGAPRGNEVTYVGEWALPQVRDVREEDTVGETEHGELPRRFIPFGTGNFLFSLFAAYRTGPQSFAVLGIAPRLIHTHWSKPGFTCFWDSDNHTSSSSFLVYPRKARLPHGDKMIIQGTATNHYPPDIDFPWSEYITLVVHCTFDSPVGLDGKGGELRMIADHGDAQKDNPLGHQNVEFVALTEDRVEYDATSFDAPFPYEYVYCGGPLYGSVNPHRLREWLAYHMRLFGQSSHFIFYDDGGLNDASWNVLEPWVKLGRLTVMNVKQEARYDTYYHSQFLLTNDCLCLAKSLARWAFFFDSDEYLYVTGSPHLELSFHKMMSEMVERGRKATSIQFLQRIMSPSLCVKNDSAPTLHESQWALEKLVYQRVLKDEERFENSGVWTHLDDLKTAVQPKYVLVMGVHEASEIELPEGFTPWSACSQPSSSEDQGCTHTSKEDKLVYYHYHKTTGVNEELCQEFVDLQQVGNVVDHDGVTYKFDNSLRLLVDIVKNYELDALQNH